MTKTNTRASRSNTGTYVNVNIPSFKVEGDTKPVYTPQQLPDIPFASMKQIARAQFTVCAGLEKEASEAEDQQFLTMNVRIYLTHRLLILQEHLFQNIVDYDENLTRARTIGTTSELR